MIAATLASQTRSRRSWKNKKGFLKNGVKVEGSHEGDGDASDGSAEEDDDDSDVQDAEGRYCSTLHCTAVECGKNERR